MPDMEVIARKHSACILLYAFGTGGLSLFVVLLIIAMVKDFAMAIAYVMVLIVFAVLLFLCIYFLVDVARTPKVAITYESGKLRFADSFECSLDDVSKVNYKCAQSRGMQYPWGELVVLVGEKEIKYRYIADVAEAHDRLLELMLEAKENNNG